MAGPQKRARSAGANLVLCPLWVGMRIGLLGDI